MKIILYQNLNGLEVHEVDDDIDSLGFIVDLVVERGDDSDEVLATIVYQVNGKWYADQMNVTEDSMERYAPEGWGNV